MRCSWSCDGKEPTGDVASRLGFLTPNTLPGGVPAERAGDRDRSDELARTGGDGRNWAMAVLGLGLAALGRPGYLTVDHGAAIGPDRSVEALRQRCLQVCDAAWEGGIRWFDAARSYGRAEEFLAGWLSRRAIEPGVVTVSSKWGYTYTADWSVDAEVPEVKDHSAAALARQWPETEALLGPWLRLYQVHSATLESGILDDQDVAPRPGRARRARSG